MRPVGKLLWPFVAGAYPCAEIMFMLQRNIGFYVIQVFFTSYRVCYQDFLLQDAMSQDQDSSLSKTATLRHAHRCVGHVIQVFVPSILTVIMSWLSFWINIESVPAARSSHPGQVVHTHTHASVVEHRERPGAHQPRPPHRRHHHLPVHRRQRHTAAGTTNHVARDGSKGAGEKGAPPPLRCLAPSEI